MRACAWRRCLRVKVFRRLPLPPGSTLSTMSHEGALGMEQEQPGRVGRRLAAIVAADVVGYSRLMELDEVGTSVSSS
jgi:class 3 adenylate cyclase